jgi:hypothetical protein
MIIFPQLVGGALLVDIGSAASRLDAFLLGLGQRLDVAVHGVLYTGQSGSGSGGIC